MRRLKVKTLLALLVLLTSPLFTGPVVGELQAKEITAEEVAAYMRHFHGAPLYQTTEIPNSAFFREIKQNWPRLQLLMQVSERQASGAFIVFDPDSESILASGEFLEGFLHGAVQSLSRDLVFDRGQEQGLEDLESSVLSELQIPTESATQTESFAPRSLREIKSTKLDRITEHSLADRLDRLASDLSFKRSASHSVLPLDSQSARSNFTRIKEGETPLVPARTAAASLPSTSLPDEQEIQSLIGETAQPSLAIQTQDFAEALTQKAYNRALEIQATALPQGSIQNRSPELGTSTDPARDGPADDLRSQVSSPRLPR